MGSMGADAAAAEFARFASLWDLDADTATMEEEDRAGFESLKRRLCRKIESGHLVIDDEGVITYTLLGAAPFEGLGELTFRMPTGAAVIAWDRFKDRQAIHKLNSFLGSMTGQSPSIFSKLDGRDLKVAQAVAQLFLGS